MKLIFRLLIVSSAATSALLSVGCTSSGSGSVSVGYSVYGGYGYPRYGYGYGGGYYRPPPVNKPDRPEHRPKPEQPIAKPPGNKPPVSRPPGNIGRPQPRPRGRR